MLRYSNVFIRNLKAQLEIKPKALKVKEANALLKKILQAIIINDELEEDTASLDFIVYQRLSFPLCLITLCLDKKLCLEYCLSLFLIS